MKTWDAPNKLTVPSKNRPIIESSWPLVSFLLFAYNQEQYIREAVEGALSQSYTPLEIILSDDGSSDGTFEIMKTMVNEYKGPHTIILNRNEINLGIGEHVNRLMGMSSGEFILLAAGDDISLPNRASVLVTHWINEGKKPMSIYSDALSIDEASQVTGNLSREYEADPVNVINHHGYVLGCAQGFSKNIFDMFGPFNSDVVNEDQVMPFRALLIGKVVRIPQRLVQYRVCRSLWKESSQNTTLDEKYQVNRYKCGVLRISALEQMKKDIRFMSMEKGCVLPIVVIEKAIEDKIMEHRFFIHFIDKQFILLMGSAFRNVSSFQAFLRALKRYVRLVLR